MFTYYYTLLTGDVIKIKYIYSDLYSGQVRIHSMFTNEATRKNNEELCCASY